MSHVLFNKMVDADAERSDADITVPDDVSSRTNQTVVSLLDRLRPPA